MMYLISAIVFGATTIYFFVQFFRLQSLLKQKSMVKEGSTESNELQRKIVRSLVYIILTLLGGFLLCIVAAIIYNLLTFGSVWK